MKHVGVMVVVALIGAGGLTTGVGCGTVKSAASAVPGASYVGLNADQPEGPQVGEKLHFKISAEEALAVLAEVAPAHGWELDATGDQYDLQGFRGKYFRLLTRRFIGGVFEMNGVFFTEPEGVYVIVGKKDTGFPQDLVAPFTEAVQAKTKP
jgi:hypothetical protein